MMRRHEHEKGECPMVPPCTGFALKPPGRWPRLIRGNQVFVAEDLRAFHDRTPGEQVTVPKAVLMRWYRLLWGFEIAPSRRKNKFTEKYEDVGARW